MSTDSLQIEQAYTSQIGDVVGSLFQTMLESSVETASDVSASSDVTALIAFGGKWSGGFVLECDHPTALALAKRFLQTDELTEFNDDVRDALGELANVMAGNLKQLLPLGTSLGAPSIIEGGDYSIRICGQRVLGVTAFQSEFGMFGVRLVEDVRKNEVCQ